MTSSFPSIAHGHATVVVPLVAVVLAAWIVALDSEDHRDEPWPEDMAGVWSVAYTQHGGPTVAARPGHLWLFDHEKKLLFWTDESDRHVVAFHCIFSVGKHCQLDLIPYNKRQVSLRAIYEILGDKMRVTGGTINGPRPLEFVDPKANHHTTFLLHEFSPFQKSRKAVEPAQSPAQSIY